MWNLTEMNSEGHYERSLKKRDCKSAEKLVLCSSKLNLDKIITNHLRDICGHIFSYCFFLLGTNFIHLYSFIILFRCLQIFWKSIFFILFIYLVVIISNQYSKTSIPPEWFFVCVQCISLFISTCWVFNRIGLDCKPLWRQDCLDLRSQANKHGNQASERRRTVFVKQDREEIIVLLEYPDMKWEKQM